LAVHGCGLSSTGTLNAIASRSVAHGNELCCPLPTRRGLQPAAVASIATNNETGVHVLGRERDHVARRLDADGKLRRRVKTPDGVLLSYDDDCIDGDVNPGRATGNHARE
jgi:hypothetical protein